MNTLFTKYTNPEPLKATVDGTEITYRELTMAESDDFNKRLIKDYNTDTGKPDINMNEVNKITYEKVAMCLIDPKVTIKDLKGMSAGASTIINDIAKLVEGKNLEEDEKESGTPND